MIGDVVVVIVW